MVLLYTGINRWNPLCDRKRMGGLIAPYLTDPDIARKFSVYYDLYRKYRSDYQISDILSGKWTEDILKRSQEARLDERFSVEGLLLEGLNRELRSAVSREKILQLVVRSLREVKKSPVDFCNALLEQSDILKKETEAKAEANNLLSREKEEYQAAEKCILEIGEMVEKEQNKKDFSVIKKQFDALVKKHQQQIKKAQKMLEAAFKFIEKAWGNHQEMPVVFSL